MSVKRLSPRLSFLTPTEPPAVFDGRSGTMLEAERGEVDPVDGLVDLAANVGGCRVAQEVGLERLAPEPPRFPGSFKWPGATLVTLPAWQLSDSQSLSEP